MVGVKLCFRDNKVAVIKFLRALTGSGLYEAKQAAEDSNGYLLAEATFIIEDAQLGWLHNESDAASVSFRKAIMRWQVVEQLPNPFRLEGHLTVTEVK